MFTVGLGRALVLKREGVEIGKLQAKPVPSLARDMDSVQDQTRMGLEWCQRYPNQRDLNES